MDLIFLAVSFFQNHFPGFFCQISIIQFHQIDVLAVFKYPERPLFPLRKVQITDRLYVHTLFSQFVQFGCGERYKHAKFPIFQMIFFGNGCRLINDSLGSANQANDQIHAQNDKDTKRQIPEQIFFQIPDDPFS